MPSESARFPWYRAPLLVAFLVISSYTPTAPGEQQSDSRGSTLVGTIENNEIDEASGIARSQLDDGVLWVINDDGPSVLHVMDDTGHMLGRVDVKDASNRDWEDLASFTLNGTPYLLLADIGDNNAERKDVRFYVVEEPEPGASKVDYAWRVDFSYPGGPRDAEAVAVDVRNERVLVLTKRDIPARLYAVPLRPDSGKRQTATMLGSIGTIPQPTRNDVALAPKTENWHWQPTSMDVSDDASRAVVLTYGGVYLFERTAGTEWIEALQRLPGVVSQTNNNKAEAITFDRGGQAIYITLEQTNSPLFRLPLDPEHRPSG